MKIIIVTENPAVSRAIEPFVRQFWPTPHLTFVHAAPYNDIRFNYPKRRDTSEYPQVTEPSNLLRSWDEWSNGPLALAEGGNLKPVLMGEELFMSADRIIYVGRGAPTDAIGFEVLMQGVFGAADTRHLSCPTIILRTLTDTAIDTAFKQIKPFGEVCEKTLQYGRVKRYFEWNWAVNTCDALGDAGRRAGVADDAPSLSKYGLQILFALKDVAPYTETVLLRMLREWPGTGRYHYPDKSTRPRLGSLTAMTKTIESLLDSGLLHKVPAESGRHELFKISQTGRRLLSLLHPGCEDLDMPFRVDAWCQQGESAKPAIDRYIRTFVSNQLQFASTARGENTQAAKLNVDQQAPKRKMM